MTEILTPKNIEEATTMLKKEDAIVFGGGTDIIPKMKRNQIKPQKLISLENIKGLNSIEYDNHTLSIGSYVKLQEVADNRIMNNFPAIKTAAASVATIAIRSMASIGGNIFQDTRCIYTDKSVLWRSGYDTCIKYGGTKCYIARSSQKCVANYQSDIAPSLLVYNSILHFQSHKNKRSIALEKLLQNDGKNHILKNCDEILIKISVPYIENFYTNYLKIAPRDSFDFPETGVALGIKYKNSKITETAIAVTGISSCAFRLKEIEEELNKKPLTIAEWETKIKTSPIKINCISATFWSTGYKQKILKILIIRLFKNICLYNFSL